MAKGIHKTTIFSLLAFVGYIFIVFNFSNTVCVLHRWGQVFILDALSRYKAADPREAENIVERVTPRLQHANCAVVLSAVKVTLKKKILWNVICSPVKIVCEVSTIFPYIVF